MKLFTLKTVPVTILTLWRHTSLFFSRSIICTQHHSYRQHRPGPCGDGMCEVCGICDVCVATLQRQAYASKGDEGASVRVKPEEEMMDKWNDWSSGSDDEREGGGSDDGSAAVRLSLSVSFKHQTSVYLIIQIFK